MLFLLLFHFPLFPEYPGQGGQNTPTAFYLFPGLLEDAVHELEVQFAHPGGAALRRIGQATVEIEGGADCYLHSVLEVWLQAAHKLFLLGGAESNPDDLCSVLFYHLCYAFVVEILDIAEREFLECHFCNIGILFGEVLLQGVEDILLGSKENHPVLALAHNVYEDVAAAIVAAFVTIYPFDELGYPTAVADGEQAAVDDLAVFFIFMHHSEYVPVGNTNVAGLAVGKLLGDSLVHGGHVKLVSYVEIFFHCSAFCCVLCKLCFGLVMDLLPCGLRIIHHLQI